MTALILKKRATGLGFPKGPMAMADGSLLFVDIAKQTVNRVNAVVQVLVVTQLPEGRGGGGNHPVRPMRGRGAKDHLSDFHRNPSPSLPDPKRKRAS
jgi:sugar lactone lactonase YvrE